MSWKKEHRYVINTFLEYLNKESKDFVLKGGTALMKCYKLDRFSEDIDLDSTNSNLIKYVDAFTKKMNYSYRIAKDTDTVKRFFISYNNTSKPLKVELSLRKSYIKPQTINTINNILVYSIEEIFKMKIMAFSGRDKIRDLYDIVYIYRSHKDQLSENSIDNLRIALEYKGIDHFDYLVKTQSDELIDIDKLTDSYLDMYMDLELLSSKEEKEQMQELKKEVNERNLENQVLFNLNNHLKDLQQAQNEHDYER